MGQIDFAEAFHAGFALFLFLEQFVFSGLVAAGRLVIIRYNGEVIKKKQVLNYNVVFQEEPVGGYSV